LDIATDRATAYKVLAIVTQIFQEMTVALHCVLNYAMTMDIVIHKVPGKKQQSDFEKKNDDIGTELMQSGYANALKVGWGSPVIFAFVTNVLTGIALMAHAAAQRVGKELNAK
jgi:hypothetical protein